MLKFQNFDVFEILILQNKSAVAETADAAVEDQADLNGIGQLFKFQNFQI